MTKVIVFLRAVMPTGPNRIPKMSFLVEILTEAGYRQVQTYIQSGNILLETEKSLDEVAAEVHYLIKKKIGANLHLIVLPAASVLAALEESPFKDVEDGSSVFFVFSNQLKNSEKLTELQDSDWGAQKLYSGKECIHMWLPWDAKPKRLSNTYLEKRLGIVSTMRNRNVIANLCKMACQ